MISIKTLQAIEFDKIVSQLNSFAVLKKTKEDIGCFLPITEKNDVLFLLKKTKEAYDLLFKYNVAGICFFEDISDELDRVDKFGTLNNSELLKICYALRSARILKNSIDSVRDDSITVIPEISKRLYINLDFEKEISDKIISEDEISDNASSKLFSIRKSIRNINAKIRERLNSYMRGSLGNYVQDAVVTVRQDRYVVPVKSEYRSFVKGFIHDQSSSGATVFIEPEQIIELNNELKREILAENSEIAKILSELSLKVSTMSDALRYNTENISDIDSFFARASYSFYNKCSMPIVNDNGFINIINGRHPLIDKQKVVPVSVKIGKDYNFLLVTGPNTGGKTVTLKMVGLIVVMAMFGLFIPADDGCEISIFNDVFCDMGDEQSIENDLSTFSSHIKKLIYILDNVNEKSLVLVDEIGAGTDPDEGSALSLAIIKKLLELNCFGIITTHYSKLKEYAIKSGKIENASMEFDAVSLKPLYKLNIGVPGSSNALDIATSLGLNKEIIKDAFSFLSEEKINYDLVIKKAEKSRKLSEDLSNELIVLKDKKLEELKLIEEEYSKVEKEREKIHQNAKQETKRIISEKLEEAEEIIDELKSILKKAKLESKELFKASELKNRLSNSRYLFQENEFLPFQMEKPDVNSLKKGNRVFVKSLNSNAEIISLKPKKNEAEVLIGDIKTIVKINDLYNNNAPVKKENKINIHKQIDNFNVSSEVNVVGKDVSEALLDVQSFLDKAIVCGLSEVKIIHGVGEGVLLKAIRDFLKNEKTVSEFRKGKYGEGENGVTIVKLK